MFIAAAIHPWTWIRAGFHSPSGCPKIQRHLIPGSSRGSIFQILHAGLSQVSGTVFVLQPAHCARSILRAAVTQPQGQLDNKLSTLCCWGNGLGGGDMAVALPLEHEPQWGIAHKTETHQGF